MLKGNDCINLNFVLILNYFIDRRSRSVSTTRTPFSGNSAASQFTQNMQQQNQLHNTSGHQKQHAIRFHPHQSQQQQQNSPLDLIDSVAINTNQQFMQHSKSIESILNDPSTGMLNFFHLYVDFFCFYVCIFCGRDVMTLSF